MAVRTWAARRPAVRPAAGALAAIAVIWLSAGVTSARAQSAPDWPSFQGGADHAGAAPGAGFAPPLRRVWQTGAPDGSVVPLDESTGHVAWRAATAGPVDAPPAASAGKVYAVSVTAAPEQAHLYALDAATGRVEWSYATAGRSGLTSSPTVAGGR